MADNTNKSIHRSEDGGTLYIQNPDMNNKVMGGCTCSHCDKSRLGRINTNAKWDTIAMDAKGTGEYWLVHYPELWHVSK